jgi:hypothetical protein
MKDADNIMMKVRNRFPEGNTEFKPGTDRDWIFNVYGATPEADPFNESVPRADVVSELAEDETADIEQPVIEQPTFSQPSKSMVKASLGSMNPNGHWSVGKPTDGYDDLGEIKPMY